MSIHISDYAEDDGYPMGDVGAGYARALGTRACLDIETCTRQELENALRSCSKAPAGGIVETILFAGAIREALARRFLDERAS